MTAGFFFDSARNRRSYDRRYF